MRIKRILGNIHKREEGITGLETAIILIAFVIVASVFAFVVLSTGLFSADRGKETVFAGLEKARGNLEVRGAVTAAGVGLGAETACGADTTDDDSDGRVNDGCAANGAAETGADCEDAVDDDADTAVNDGCPVYELVGSLVFNLANAAGGEPVLVDPAATTNSTVINWIDAEDRIPDTTYTVDPILGDGDDLLEPGELFEITVATPTGSNLDPNETFTLEVVPPAGGVSLIARTMPPEIDLVMDLH
jgi:flagellin FlaB